MMEDKLSLSLTPATLDYVIKVLAQRPYAEVATVIQDIASQVQGQQAPQALRPNGAAEINQEVVQ